MIFAAMEEKKNRAVESGREETASATVASRSRWIYMSTQLFFLPLLSRFHSCRSPRNTNSGVVRRRQRRRRPWDALWLIRLLLERTAGRPRPPHVSHRVIPFQRTRRSVMLAYGAGPILRRWRLASTRRWASCTGLRVTAQRSPERERVR